MSDYIKFLYRFSMRNKASVLIALMSLIIGISSVFYIMLFTIHELGYDSFHEKSSLIYRVTINVQADGTQELYATTGKPVGEMLKKDFPEITDYARFTKPDGKSIFRLDGRLQDEWGVYLATPSVFKIFSYKVIEGDPTLALTEPNGMVITESFSNKYFGDVHSTGKTLSLNDRNYKVTGVIEDLPGNSHLKFQVLVSAGTENLNYDLQDWFNFDNYTYILTDPKADETNIRSKLPQFATRYLKTVIDEGVKVSFEMQPLRKIHYIEGLQMDLPSGRSINLWLFSLVNIFLILSASINYINISIALSFRRSGEIGIRKTMGASRTDMIRQLLTETAVISLIAGILSFFVIIGLLPVFRSLIDIPVTIGDVISPSFFATVIVVMLLVVGIGGGYPALVLSNLQPLNILRKKTSVKENVRVRKFFLTMQFSIAMLLAVFTLMINNQIDFMEHAPLGFSPSKVMILNLPSDTTQFNNYQAFRGSLLNESSIIQASLAGYGSIPGEENGKELFQMAGSKGTQVKKVFNLFEIDENYIGLLGIKLVKGSNFSIDKPASTLSGVLVNEKLVKEMAWKDPINQKISHGKEEYRVIGVVKDFHHASLHNAIEPVMLMYRKSINSVLVKTNQTSLDRIEALWRTYFPDEPFAFRFLDDSVAAKYTAEKRVNGLLVIFSSVLLLLVGLGVLGLSAIIVNQKNKEIGVRMVFGADNVDIMIYIVRDFLLLIGIGFLIAAPLSWFLPQKWRSTFAYLAPVEVLNYLIPVGAIILLVLLMVGISVRQVLRRNPVRVLREI